MVGRGAYRMLLVATLCAATSLAQAQPRPPQLCFLTFDAATLESNRYGAFFRELRARGYLPGQTITVDFLSAQSRGESFEALARDCVRRKPDLIATTTTPAAQAAKGATSAIPIVMLTSGDPLGAGLVKSLARPGGNVTGQSFMAGDLAAKRLELLKEVLPALSRVLVLTYPADPISAPQVQAMQAAARKLRVTLQVRDVHVSDDIQVAVVTGLKEAPDALLTTSESIFFQNRQRILELAARHRLPGVYAWRPFADAGGLMSYAQDNSELHRRAAVYVDRILKGAKPSELPVEQPATFEFVVNRKAARALGIAIPQGLVLRATEVID